VIFAAFIAFRSFEGRVFSIEGRNNATWSQKCYSGFLRYPAAIFRREKCFDFFLSPPYPAWLSIAIFGAGLDAVLAKFR
jgi:hypothetical protein